MDLLIMCLHLLCFLALSSNAQAVGRGELFLRRRNLDGSVGQGFFLETKTRSRIQCSRVCLGNSECRSFTYEEDRRACYLHHSLWPLPGDSRPGAATFYRARCPQDWDLLNGTLCVKLISEERSWQSAIQNCLQLGGNLISVETQMKESLLRTYLQTRNVAYAWLGASDLEVEGKWKWEATGDTGHISWWPSQPDNATGENCLLLTNSGREMHDYTCSDSYGSVCEIPL